MIVYKITISSATFFFLTQLMSFPLASLHLNQCQLLNSHLRHCSHWTKNSESTLSEHAPTKPCLQILIIILTKKLCTFLQAVLFVSLFKPYPLIKNKKRMRQKSEKRFLRLMCEETDAMLPVIVSLT